MKLTTKGRFAVAATIDLALHAGVGGKPVQLRDISLRQCISLSYLEQIFMQLKKNGIVKSVRGPGGGYLLSRQPSRITVADIVDGSGERRTMMLCEGAENCSDSKKCIAHELWKGLDECIFAYLRKCRLSDLIASAEVASVAKRQQDDFVRSMQALAGNIPPVMMEPRQ